MFDHRTLEPGTRVRIVGHPIGVQLDRATGTIVRPDIYDDHYVIRLDAPAMYRHLTGEMEPMPEIVQDVDNLDVLDSPNNH